MADEISSEDSTIVKITVLMFAVEALIATHPEPEKVKAALDRLIGQFQADVLISGAADPVVTRYLRKMTDTLFSSSHKP